MGGKSKPDPPDYAPVAEASDKAAKKAHKLGMRQLKFSRQQYWQNRRDLLPIANAQKRAMNQQYRQAKDYYGYNVDTFRPLERGLVADAERFDTEAYQEGLASQAAADAARAFSQTKAMRARDMASMGINPNSGRFQGMNRADGLALAARRADAMTDTRTQADQLGWAKRLDAAGLGRNLPGASTAAYGSATAAGNSAAGNYMAPGAQHMQGLAQGASTVMQGQGQRLTGLSNIMNTQASVYNNYEDPWMTGLGIVGSVGASAAGAGAFNGLFSDRRLKQDIVRVGTYDNGLPMYEFAYKASPAKRFRGVMADDVERVMPEAVVEVNGYKAVRYDKLDVDLEAVQ